MSFAQTNPSEEIPYQYLRAEIMKPDLHFLGLEEKAMFYNPHEKASFICYARGVKIVIPELYKMETGHLILRLFGF